MFARLRNFISVCFSSNGPVAPVADIEMTNFAEVSPVDAHAEGAAGLAVTSIAQ